MYEYVAAVNRGGLLKGLGGMSLGAAMSAAAVYLDCLAI